ncbi:MAG TPA: cupin domain-containing protein [Candidatus Acidoferrales bacterium]|nr:cupin domain-containing protein [Candidatus Acidoferrales bacterium]
MPWVAEGCRVLAADEGAIGRRGVWSSRVILSRAFGAKHISAAVNEYAPGRGPLVTNGHAEELHYVVSGAGNCRIGGFAYPLEPGAGLFVPPGRAFGVENPGPESLVTVSVCCPEEGAPRILEGAWGEPEQGAGPVSVVHEREREAIPVADRKFKLLVDTEFGCRQVTQFLGFIPPSRAPFHFHTYEEVIYILEGSGIVRAGGASTPFAPGASIYLPIGLPHCVENPGPGWVRLLGVFYPAGSPAVAYEE